MKTISIKVQQRIMFIPYVNTLNWFIWWYNCNPLKVSSKIFAKGFFIILFYLLPGIMFFIVIQRLLPSVYEIISPLAIYVNPVLMSWGSIQYQKKLITDGDLKSGS